MLEKSLRITGEKVATSNPLVAVDTSSIHEAIFSHRLMIKLSKNMIGRKS